MSPALKPGELKRAVLWAHDLASALEPATA
jgi:hypothetical protein